MKFCEFINKLFPHYSCANKERFILQIFSALCGESNPVETSKLEENLKDENDCDFTLVGSPLLPRGLRGADKKARSALYGGNGYVGLSAPIREHILAKQTDDTKGAFVFYSENNISNGEFTKLCEDLSVPTDTKHNKVYGAIYEQFMEFAKSRDDNAENIIDFAVKGTTSSDGEKTEGSHETATDADPKRITVNNIGPVENQKFISIETMNGDINL